MTKVEADVQVQLATRIPKALHRVKADRPLMEFVVEALQERLDKLARRKRLRRAE